MKNIYIILIYLISSFGLFAQSYQITNLAVVNSEFLDFSPVRYQDGMLFTSTRDNSCKCKDKKTDDNFSNLYYANLKSGKIEEVVGDINGNHHDGVATVSNNRNFMYFTRTNKSGRSSLGLKDLKIYKLKNEDNIWVKDSDFDYNNNEYATAHPTLSTDGLKMYFASNRPGSIGGMDIWYCVKDKSGNWGMPINMGATVNTKGSELFPFVSETEELFFSSDGQLGSQKLDVYKVPLSNLSAVVKLDQSINTPFDDFGYVEYSNGTEGYFSSNRPGGKGGDDIYSFQKTNTPLQKCKIYAVDASSNSKIYSPTFNINSAITNSDIVEIVPNKSTSYTIAVNKPGYMPKEINISGLELTNTSEYAVPLVKIKPATTLSKIVIKSKATQQLVANSSLKIDKQCSNNNPETIISNDGTLDLEMECNCNYTIAVTKEGYTSVAKSFKAPSCDNMTTITNVIELDPVIQPKIFEGTEIKKGAVITLKDIYYNYNKYDIRPDAKVVLDKVVNLLNQYPTLEIELASHTDSRGNNQYNQTLSQNRAQAAVEYIVSRGVQSNRLKAVGYGEQQLKNRCADGIKCNNKEHQANRRTEIRVLKFDEPTVHIIRE